MTPTERFEEEKKLAAYREQLKIIKANQPAVTTHHSEELTEVTSEYINDKISILEKEIEELEQKLGYEE